MGRPCLGQMGIKWLQAHRGFYAGGEVMAYPAAIDSCSQLLCPICEEDSGNFLHPEDNYVFRRTGEDGPGEVIYLPHGARELLTTMDFTERQMEEMIGRRDGSITVYTCEMCHCCDNSPLRNDLFRGHYLRTQQHKGITYVGWLTEEEKREFLFHVWGVSMHPPVTNSRALSDMGSQRGQDRREEGQRQWNRHQRYEREREQRIREHREKERQKVKQDAADREELWKGGD